MSDDENPTGELLAKVSFPLYTIKALSGQHILVAGGGGSAKTGVANGFVSICSTIIRDDLRCWKALHYFSYFLLPDLNNAVI